MHEHAHAGMRSELTEGHRLPLGNLPGTRYPDPRIEALDKRFKAKQGNAAIERIATGFRWAEGPVYFADGGYLLWSDIPNNRIMRWLEEDGVRCYELGGALIGKIHLPEAAANLCFGGKKRYRLFIAASTSVYSVHLNATGAQRP